MILSCESGMERNMCCAELRSGRETGTGTDPGAGLGGRVSVPKIACVEQRTPDRSGGSFFVVLLFS